MQVLVFACRSDDRLGHAFSALLTRGGVRVVRVAQEEAAITEAAAGRAAFLGGFSRGARLAARVADATGARGLVLLGYPFHPKGEPQERAAERRLAMVRAPSLVLQGERDAHGNRQAVRTASARMQLVWLTDGNHRFVPRAASGLTQADLIGQAAEAALAFMRAHA